MLIHLYSVSLPKLRDAWSLVIGSIAAQGLDCKAAMAEWNRTLSTRTGCVDATCGKFLCQHYPSIKIEKPLLEGPNFYAVVTVVPIVTFLLIFGLVIWCMTRGSNNKEKATAQKNIELDGVTIVGDNDIRRGQS